MKNEVRGCIVRHNAGPGDDFFQETIPTTQAAVANLYKNRRSGQKMRYPRFGAFEVKE